MAYLCCHLANILYLGSYLGRDMLWLRILTCAGLVLGIIFFACQPVPFYGPAAWQLGFLVINLYQIRSLVIERRQVMLNEKQERLAQSAFQNLSRDELLTLLTHMMSRNSESQPDINLVAHQPLNKEESVLRDIAFSRLSRNEILNLLTRRMWKSITRLNPMTWNRQRREDANTIAGSLETLRPDFRDR